MQYEATASHLNHMIRAERVQGMTFGRHMQYSFEFFYVKKGEVLCTVEDETYPLQEGDGVLVLPNQPHSYHTPVCSDAVMLIFDPIYVNEFFQYTRNKEFVCPVYRPDGRLLEQLPHQKDVFGWKSLLYSLCAQANQQGTLRQATRKNSDLIEKVVAYIHDHLQDKLSMEQLAEELGYSYHYLSNCMKDHFGMNFCTLVNHYRIDRAATLLRTTDLPMTRVADQSGFSTIRSFNRAFLSIHGITPTQFAKKVKYE